jgi:pimeloyl-ACP methyl ester carboxylesterase
MRDYRSLPEQPSRPHDFQTLPRKSIAVHLPGRAAPFTLSYVETGSGPPMLLIHGLMTSAYSYRYVASALARQHRVIVLDLPGAGQSDAPRDLSQRPQDLAGVIAAFIEAMHLSRPYVVGNSLGGYVSLWLALLHPERVGRLLVMHSPGIPEVRLHLLHALLSLPGSRALFNFYTRHREQFALDNAHYRDESIKSREETREYSRWTADELSRELFFRQLRETMSPYEMKRLPAAIAQARAENRLPPIRLIWSRWDPLVPPAFGPKYQALLPESELVWIDDSSHFLHVDTPEAAVREILRFA